MKAWVLICLLLFVCLSAYGSSKSATEKVVVLADVPTTTNYDWDMPGKGTASCSASGCSVYYRPPQSGTQTIQGAILRLRRNDGSIVIAECLSKGRLAASMIQAMANPDISDPMIYRDCRVPEPDESHPIDAEFHTTYVKLTFVNLNTERSGRIWEEKYLIKGTLHPAPAPAAVSNFAFEPETGSRDISCGPVGSIVKVHADKKNHEAGQASPEQDLIYVIQEDEFRVKVLGGFPTRYGIDTAWVGGNNEDSYFFAPVAPGDHHICGEWQVNFKNHVRPMSLARFKAEAGREYYFRARVVFSSIYDTGERSITLEPISEAEGKALVARLPHSSFKYKD